MPPASHGYQPTDDGLRRAADAERQARASMMARAWDYYEGRHARPLKVRSGGTDNNVIVNLIALHADHTVAFAVPDFPTLELDALHDTETERQIRALWRQAGGANWLATLMLGGVFSGHVFVRVLPPDPTAGTPFPRLIKLNPANVLCFWEAGDVSRLLWYEVQYTAEGETRRQDILAPGAADNVCWQIREYSVNDVGGATLRSITDWPYVVPPLIDWQHLPRPGAYYGAHELTNVGLNDAVNKVASDVKAILRTHASPRLVGFGFQADKLQETAVDALWTIPDSDARVQILEMNSDLASSMAYMRFLTDTYMQLARVTVLSGGPDAYKGVTNLGIRSAFMAQLAKTRTLQAAYGDGLARLTQAAFSLMGQPIALPEVKWRSALPESDLENIQALAQERALGIVSQETIAAQRGYQWEVEKARMATDTPSTTL